MMRKLYLRYYISFLLFRTIQRRSSYFRRGAVTKCNAAFPWLACFVAQAPHSAANERIAGIVDGADAGSGNAAGLHERTLL